MMICATVGMLFVAFREFRFGAFNVQRFTKIALFGFAGFFFYIFLALVNYNGDYQLGVTPNWQRPVVMLYDWAQGKRNLDDTREHQLQVVEENIGDNLVVGTGPKNYGVEYEVDEIHNTYAGVLFQLGVPGLFLFLAWLGLVVYAGWRSSHRIGDNHQRLKVICMLVGMSLLLLYSMTMFGLRQRNIWLLAGLLVATESLVPRRKGLGNPRVGANPSQRGFPGDGGNP
jgi:O-antigen ligase